MLVISPRLVARRLSKTSNVLVGLPEIWQYPGVLSVSLVGKIIVAHVKAERVPAHRVAASVPAK